MTYNINKEELVYNDFLKIYKAEVTHDTFNNDKKITAYRLALDKGNAIAVLLYEKDTDSFLFIRQFRYPSARHGYPWTLELPAGAIDKNETTQGAAIREVEEEIGYQVDQLEFYGEVTSEQKTSKGGGSISEKEDIELVKIPRSEIHQKLQERFFNNSISIIGLQWYLLNKLKITKQPL
jgi:ADP-ribose pyrophosphatase